MLVKQDIKADLIEALRQFYSDEQSSLLTIDVPKNVGFGDYSSNISFILAKSEKSSPQLISEDIVRYLSSDKGLLSKYAFSSVNGFVNIRILDHYLWSRCISLFEAKPMFPVPDRKILLEFVSANPTGPLHIGHGRWAAIGSVIQHLYVYIGADITTEFYINDAGVQIGLFEKSIQAVRDGLPIPDDGYHGEYIIELARQSQDPVQLIIERQRQELARFGVEFDSWFSEKQLHQTHQLDRILVLLADHHLTYHHENAVWFKSSEFGDEKDRVLIKENLAPTYFAIDIAYHFNKLERGFTSLINIWGADHHGYVARLRAALKAICQAQFDVDRDFVVIIGQLVSLFRLGEPVRMSKRTGDMITLAEVIDEIGVDAARFFLLHTHSDSHLEFDLDVAKHQSNDNPVFYIQYAYARICSILRKFDDSASPIISDMDAFQFNQYERAIMMRMIQVYDEIYDAAMLFAPHRLTYYTLNLAKDFHGFYEHCPIIKADPFDQAKRLILIRQLKSTFALSLRLLGVSAPESM